MRMPWNSKRSVTYERRLLECCNLWQEPLDHLEISIFSRKPLDALTPKQYVTIRKIRNMNNSNLTPLGLKNQLYLIKGWWLTKELPIQGVLEAHSGSHKSIIVHTNEIKGATLQFIQHRAIMEMGGI